MTHPELEETTSPAAAANLRAASHAAPGTNGSSATLARPVSERDAELESANRELVAENERLRAMTCELTHELRGSLRVLEGFATMLAEEHGESLDDRARYLIERMIAVAVDGGRTVNEFLAMERAGAAELEPRTVDLGEIAEEIFGDLQTMAAERDVELVVGDDLTVEGDCSLLRVLLQNLIGNAFKFTKNEAHARIEIGMASARDGRGLFFVRDNGAGFDPEGAERMFRTFARLHCCNEFDGTGVGLATVARVVARHGGAVCAEGAPGEGATIYFELPRTASATPLGRKAA